MFRYIIFILITALPALAFFPEPVQRSEAEIQIASDLARAESDTEILQIGKRYLRNYPDDIPACKEAQIAIGGLLEDKVAFFRTHHDELQSLASYYLYARATDFTLPEADVEAMVNKNKNSFWAWLMFMATEWHKEQPNLEVVIDRAEEAVTLDGSRPEGYYYLSLAYLEADRLTDARDALEAAIVCDPLNIEFREMLLDVYLKLRDADGYFALLSGVLPEKPAEISLAALDNSEDKDSIVLQGQVSLLVHWALGSEICINRTLQDMNKAMIEKQLQIPIYAMHIGDENTDPTPYITETDKSGNEWQMEFVKSNDEFDKQLNLTQKPCIYVIGPDGYIHALINGKGHSEDLIETVIWLADEIAHRNSH
jgi:tetratricopeptide (TPR) repeat protein